MFGIILKNLWNRRGRYAWLFIELVIVSCLAWFIVDRAAVNINDRNLPLGYDPGRLMMVDIKAYPPESPNYRAEAADSAVRVADYERVMTKIRNYEGVESATVIEESNYLNAMMLSLNAFKAGVPFDSCRSNVLCLYLPAGSSFYETYGIETCEGSPSAAELAKRGYAPGEHIITRSYAEHFWPGENAVGKTFRYVSSATNDTVYEPIVAVIENVRYRTGVRSTDLVFTMGPQLEAGADAFRVIVRVKDGSDIAAFANDFRDWASQGLLTGNYYCKSVRDYPSIIDSAESENGLKAEFALMVALAFFFLINLMLGVTASFYLQTRRRIEEMGIHRSAGACRGHIVGMLMGEGAILATVAVTAGELIYLQIAQLYGLANGNWLNDNLLEANSWVNNFWEHFGLISAIVCVIILVCTLLGTWLPARKVSRIAPVEALRDE